jgi:hypothetical protein
LADRCLVHKLQNEALQLIYLLIDNKEERRNNSDVEKFLRYAYQAKVDTPLKRLAAHRFAYSNEKSLTSLGVEYTAWLIELLKALAVCLI